MLLPEGKPACPRATPCTAWPWTSPTLSLVEPSRSPARRAGSPPSAALLDQTLFLEATAHGKHLFCAFDDDRVLHIHLGLIGKLTLGPPDPPVGEVRVRIATPEVAADLRGPQLCAVRTPVEVATVIAELGPDPLRADADPELAWRRIHRATRPIAALLMDQTILSGVGNVYRAEVLFRNRVNPHRPGNRLSRRSWQGIWSDLVGPDAGGRTPQPDRHRPPRAHSGGDGPSTACR